MNEFVSVHVDDNRPGIGTIVLSRPPANALTRQAYREIIAAAAEVGARDDIGAVILFGSHEIFSAGDELDELRTLTAAQADLAAQLRQAAIDALAAIPKPTVAAVTGYALGSGLSLALAADRRVSGDNAKLGSTDILAGMIPSGGGTQRLLRAIGPSRTKDLVFSGRFVDAEEALAIGLLDEMVAPDNVYDAAADWAARFVGGPSDALAAAKAAIDGGAERPLADAVEHERRLYVEVFPRAPAVRPE
ncbi:enoyl-CoA hydratase [Mycobacterium sp.]|uniref:enoyl-CoA hydratase n=1 Tax=Mycobacterium sp. TaxID=1785 RepID=UPI002D36D197|nr:enoyl-CoA hydratase [Mycobacterium sp.]HZA10592.1 enoyl-CoA hydratase [Mycobacterium sp.]